MLHHGRLGDVRVDPRTHAVTLDGRPVEAPPVEDLALSGRYLLG
jgi:urease alpha subunit